MSRMLHALLGRLPIGWLQLIHNKPRLLAAVGGVTFANILIFMQLGFMGALFESSVQGHREFDADIVVMSSDYTTLREANPLPRVRIGQVLSHESVESGTEVYQGTIVWTDERAGVSINFRMNGVDPDARVFRRPEVQALLPRLKEANTALLDRRTRELGAWLIASIDAGETPEIEVAGRRIRVVGLFEQGASFDVDGAMITSTSTFARLLPKRGDATPTMILAMLRPEDRQAEMAEQVARSIQARIPEGDASVFTKAGFVGVEKAYQMEQSPIGFVFGFGVVMGLVVGMVIIYQVLATDVADHLAEYATFKAIGYAPKFFFSIVLEEAVCLAALGFLPALLIATTLYHLAASATALPISMPWSRPLLVLSMTVAVAVASGAIATRRLRYADPAELF